MAEHEVRAVGPLTGDIAAYDGAIPDSLEHLLAGASIVAAQQPSRSSWSPEKRLAGTILASALVEVRDRHADRDFRKRVIEDLQWIVSDDSSWPFSFVRLCHLFDLEPAWVRMLVRRWVTDPSVGLSSFAPASELPWPCESGPAWSPPASSRTDVLRRDIYAALA